MKNYKIIGITGQSGAGKSTVSQLISGENVFVINADELVSDIYTSYSPCITALTKQFGCDILYPDGTLNRTVLAQRAFASKESTAVLNSIVHPFVTALFLYRVKNAVQNGARLIVFDAPQLFESNTDILCDVIIGVTAKAETRLNRICKRDGISQDLAIQRINAQLSEEFFIENCDYVIINDGNTDNIKQQVQSIISALTNRGD